LRCIAQRSLTHVKTDASIQMKRRADMWNVYFG
jgi:hypothetical protein